MNAPRQTQPFALPEHYVLVMSESRHQMSMVIGALDGGTMTFERIDRPTALTARAGYQQYDLIVIDLDHSREDLLGSIAEIRRLEESRCQPPTPILGVTADDDALAALDLQNRGVSEVHRGSVTDPSFQQLAAKAVRGMFQTA